MSSVVKHIGLGLILSSIRFSVSVTKVHWGFGFTSSLYIHIPHDNEKQVMAMSLWAGEEKLVLKERIKSKTEINSWLKALETYKHLLHDITGYEKMAWVLANPLPSSKGNKPLNVFIEWVKKWDELNESYLN